MFIVGGFVSSPYSSHVLFSTPEIVISSILSFLVAEVALLETVTSPFPLFILLTQRHHFSI